MTKLFSTGGLARASARRPWLVVGVWIGLVVLSVGLMIAPGMRTTTGFEMVNEPESVQGMNLMSDRLGIEEPLTETIIVRSTDGRTVDDPAFEAEISRITAGIRVLQADGVVDESPTAVVNFYELTAMGLPDAAGLVSEDRTTTLIPVTLAGGMDDLDAATKNGQQLLSLVDGFTSDGFELFPVGIVSINEEFNHIAEQDLIKGESIGVGAALIILVVVFGALVAAGVPVLLAIMAIIVSFGLTTVISQIFEVSFFITNMITMFGLALGIDYSLFVVERYREERRRGAAVVDAVSIAGNTASRAVFFSGMTVFLALLGMFLVPTTIFRSLGAGAILVVLVSVSATLTLVPALLSLLGDHLDWPRRRRYDQATAAATRAHDQEVFHSGFWGRIARVVMGRPIISVVLATGFLLLTALPVINLETGAAGVESLPEGNVKTAFTILNEDFSAGRLAPLEVVIDGQHAEVADAVDGLYQTMLAGTANFAAVRAPEWNAAGDLAHIEATLAFSPNDARAYDVVDALRSDIIPFALDGVTAATYVTGDTAINADFFSLVDTWTPLVLAFVLGLSFLLLLLVFRSVVIPVKAILMNLLSVGSALGLITLVFQSEFLSGLFGFQQTQTIEAWLPIFLFCVLFGLSMDYHVFLLSRIREHFDQTGRNTESVASGLQATGRIITGAALIMVAVFSGFATGRLVMLQQLGFGLAVSVLVDATLIRSVLVPASMALLGKWNWYLPSWLNWLPNLNVEGGPTQGPAPVDPARTPVPVGTTSIAGD